MEDMLTAGTTPTSGVELLCSRADLLRGVGIVKFGSSINLDGIEQSRYDDELKGWRSCGGLMWWNIVGFVDLRPLRLSFKVMQNIGDAPA